MTVAFVNLLLAERRARPKPLVYMSHPEDLCQKGPDCRRSKFSLKSVASHCRRVPVRHYLAAREPEYFFAVNMALLGRLQRANGTGFLTVQDYVRQFLSAPATQTQMASESRRQLKIVR